MRTIGVTGGTRPALAIWARLSMYCRQSRSRPESHGLCSISNTQPSYFDALNAIAESTCAGAKQVSACWPASSARMMLLRRGSSAMLFPLGYRAGPTFPPSLLGLTQASIFWETMDCRVKPGNDKMGANRLFLILGREALTKAKVP